LPVAEAISKKDALRHTRFFAGATETVLDQFAAAGVLETVPAGTTILYKDGPGSAFFIIVEGRAEVHVDELTLAILSPQDTFGELSTLENGLCSASVTAITQLVVLRLDRDPMLKVMSTNPGANALILQSLCRVLRERSEQFAQGAHQRRTLERELEIGRKIQAGFLPSSLPAEDGWEIGAYFRAAREVAGDFYDAFRIDRIGRIALVIGDVCDKGVGAALFMTLFRSLLRAAASSEEFVVEAGLLAKSQDEHAAALLRNSVQFANDYIARTHGDTSMFATIFFGLLDSATGNLLYVNGGHEEPVILSDGKVVAELANTGPALGLFPGVLFNVGEAQLSPGQTLFSYTDGATDAPDVAGQAFGRERLLQLAVGCSLSADGLVASTAAALDHYTAGAEQFDDITMLAVTGRPIAK
jgi:serine phosphatase RsbU (regulator of sigma subunit)